ncbi:DUF1273 domain-containing protein [Micromonospora sp. RV43]|uniref:DUF1273 domain-containing protein n=1 Tax=Micromonospora sp. RV43 TaxID=1661387 RepID=UPI00128AFA02|nr:DUF1273 domain-containing protein [Micromonospora sp. RV43]
MRVAVKLREEHGTQIGVSGMALGVDTWWAQAVLAAGMELWAYVPFPQQPAKWQPADQEEWRRLRALASRVREFGPRYDVRLLHARNDGMLLDAKAVTAVWLPGKKDGGTYSAVRKAGRLRLPVIHLDPRRLRTSLPNTEPAAGADRGVRPDYSGDAPTSSAERTRSDASSSAATSCGWQILPAGGDL